MSVGSVERLATMRGFLALALPLAMGFGVNWVMQFTNRLFLSWYSPDALAAALPAGIVVYAAQAPFLVSAAYLGVFAAQHLGAGENAEVGAMAWPMLWLAAAAGILSLIAIPFASAIFSLLGSSPVVTAQMSQLGAWYLAETLPVVLLGGFSGWFGGIGRTHLVLGLALGVCVSSVAFNYWLIFGGLGVPSLGVHGAGLATVLATSIGALCAGMYFFSSAMRTQFSTWSARNFDAARWWRFVHTAVPRGLTESLEVFAFMLFTAIIARIGDDQLAASNLVLNLYLLILVPLTGLSQGVTIAVGQAVGAERIDIARRVVRHAMTVVLIVMIPCALAAALIPQQILAISVRIDDVDPVASAARWQHILDLAQPLMWCVAGLCIFDGLHLVWRFAVQGAGDTRWPLIALTLAAFFLLGAPTAIIITLVPDATWTRLGINPLTACWLVFAGYICSISLIVGLRYRYGPWARMSVRSAAITQLENLNSTHNSAR